MLIYSFLWHVYLLECSPDHVGPRPKKEDGGVRVSVAHIKHNRQLLQMHFKYYISP